MGREFLGLFEEWADSYDDSVAGIDPQYRAVFADYDKILKEVCKCSFGHVLEFGVGTGNLSAKLMEFGYKVTGVEPSAAMRKKASEKLPELELYEGDFLNYPALSDMVHTIVSTYAFHHLTDLEKEEAVRKFAGLLYPTGKIVFADTVFKSEEQKEQVTREALEQGYNDLAADLKREYYTTIPELRGIFTANGFHVTFEQMNSFVWLIAAVKK
ncbi:class I SAM-dependent DNA methyltransferase [Virgibacillus kekensis]|uniref:Uncharacterized methyltransferase ACFO3D_13015 n=1 Tax=Virgibacillus kekensis TaxID=202261 RepID=A0ABV9DKF8_9BACI